MKTTRAVTKVPLGAGPGLLTALPASPCCALMSGEDSASELACASRLATGSAACVLQGRKNSHAYAQLDGMRFGCDGQVHADRPPEQGLSTCGNVLVDFCAACMHISKEQRTCTCMLPLAAECI